MAIGKPQKGVSLFDSYGTEITFAPIGINYHMPTVDASAAIPGSAAPSTALFVAGIDSTGLGVLRGLTVTPDGALVVIGEDEEDAEATKIFSANTGATTVVVPHTAVNQPVLSIRPLAGQTTTVFLLRNLRITGDGNRVFWQLIYNGTLTGADFQSVNANSGVSYDTAATAISGGEVIDSGYMQFPEQASYQAHFGFTSNVADTLTLVVTPMTGSGRPRSISTSMRWTERSTS